MTAINLSTQIPSNINSLEKLIAWGGLTLAYVNPQLGVLESADRAEKVAQSMIFQAADDTYRLLIRACMPISNNYMTDRSIKLWMHTQDVSNVAIPAGFSAN